RLGWRTEVVDTQARPVSRERFDAADAVTLARPEEVAGRVRVTPRTLALLMTHNYAHDRELLKFLLASPARYVGVMGPRKRTERMLRELVEGDGEFRLEESDGSRLYSPAGLDIGANSPAEVALSIVAELAAFLAGRGGGMLRERRGSIHGSLSDGEGVPVLEAGTHTSAPA
ncbi:MAG TPA: XdhC family protein, partial [Pyrinomonadaceae bacterium]|nr:XdhC family protein [Pyrinomonadaceae bacterium]